MAMRIARWWLTWRGVAVLLAGAMLTLETACDKCASGKIKTTQGPGSYDCTINAGAYGPVGCTACSVTLACDGTDGKPKSVMVLNTDNRQRAITFADTNCQTVRSGTCH